MLEDLPHKDQTIYETAEHLDKQATYYEHANHVQRKQFMEEDKRLDMIREEAARRERELDGERERVREARRDADFAEEQMDLRIIRQEKQWDKNLCEQQEKIEIIKLAQSKTIDERDKLQRELNRKKDSHQVQVEAWNKELSIIMREQAISAMIQESYVKEIDRVKKQQILHKAMIEES